ncbi:MAG TPA: hypothetical protein VGK59_21100 [Ohtaekwangia sp.]
MSKKENDTNKISAETNDKVIADLIEKRKIQQEALIKIMTSMDKNQGLPQAGEPVEKKTRFRSKKTN